MNNTIGSAVKTLNQIDGLIERVDAAKDGSEISQSDLILIVNILDQVRGSILKATAYPPIELEGDGQSA